MSVPESQRVRQKMEKILKNADVMNAIVQHTILKHYVQTQWDSGDLQVEA